MVCITAAKLTIDQMVEMRNNGVSPAEIAKQAGVSRAYVYNVTKCRTNPGMKLTPGRHRKDPPPTDPDTLSDDQVRELVERRKKSNSPLVNSAGNSSVEEMREMMRSVLRWYGKPIVKSDEECAERLNNFFNVIAETGELPTVEKMCLALGADRRTVWDWENGTCCSPARAQMIKQAKSMLAALDAEMVSKNKQPVVSYIFRAKNFYGMKDQTDVVVTPNNPLGTATSAEDIASKYAELPDE